MENNGKNLPAEAEPETEMMTVAELAINTVFKDIPPIYQAMGLELCKQFGLDALQGHLVIFPFTNRRTGKTKYTPYITRDGLLNVAHNSKQFDGMPEVEIKREENPITGKDDVSARVEVYRKDASRPFVMKIWLSEYDNNKNAWGTHKIAMFSKTAIVTVLRVAFNVGISAVEEMDRVFEREGVEFGAPIMLPPLKVQAITEKKKYPETVAYWEKHGKEYGIQKAFMFTDMWKERGYSDVEYIPLEVAKEILTKINGAEVSD